jgi:ElaB/YqjD/DUF883 family membrane-anchored ribosome-binding protein
MSTRNDADNKGSTSKKLNERSMASSTHDILDNPVAADREQLSNLETRRTSAGTQPDWETGRQGGATGVHTGGTDGRTDGRSADYAGRLGEHPGRATGYQSDSGSQNSRTGAGGQDNSDSGNLRDRAEHAADRTRQMASRARHSVQDSYESGRRQINRQASRAQSRISDALDDNPLALVAVAVGIGAAIGLLLPSTRRENQLMGPQRDRLKRQILDTGAEQLRHAREQLDEVGKGEGSESSSEEAKSNKQSSDKNQQTGAGKQQS